MFKPIVNHVFFISSLKGCNLYFVLIFMHHMGKFVEAILSRLGADLIRLNSLCPVNQFES